MNLESLSNLIDESYDIMQAAYESDKSGRLNFGQMSNEINATITECRKQYKSGNYKEAMASCDEGIRSIERFEKAVKDTSDADLGDSNIWDIVVRIGKAVLVAVAMVAASKGIHKVYSKRQHKLGLKEVEKSHGRLNRLDKEYEIRSTFGASKKTKEKMADKYVRETNRHSNKMDNLRGRLDTADNISKGVNYAAAGVVGVSTISALASFIKSRRGTKVDMLKALDVSKKTLIGIKQSCQNAMKGEDDANESAFYYGVLEALLDENDSFIGGLISCGIHEAQACEAYVEALIGGDYYYE